MSWTKYKKAQESLLILGDIARFCSKLGGQQCEELIELLNKDDYLGIINFSVDYTTTDVADVIYARQIIGLYSKNPTLPLGVNRTDAAIERFNRAEQMCLATNERIRHRGARKNARAQTFLFKVQQKISAILGSLPPPSELNFSFGPGANTNVKSARANPRVKLSARLACSSNLAPVIAGLLTEVPEWCRIHNKAHENEQGYIVEVDIVPAKLVFVPKNAVTDRSICIEPLLNGFFQKGVGQYIRERLLRFGVDLRDQTRNQKLALQGSINGDLATVDLSMASDCLAREVVFDLLPPEWSELLDYLRSSEVVFEGTTHVLEKFSSMGNGFTFELESLLFYAVAAVAVEDVGLSLESTSVYGDDIIVPVEAYDLVEEMLGYLGFEFNRSKSYRSGLFRESCGADYFRGIDIRPYYQKTLISERTLFTMHNWFMRHCEFELAGFVAQLTSPVYRLYGPDGYGDGHLIGAWQPRLSREGKRRGWGGGYFETYTLKPLSFSEALPGDAVLPVYSVYVRSGMLSPTDPNVIRGSKGYAKLSIYTLKTGIFR